MKVNVGLGHTGVYVLDHTVCFDQKIILFIREVAYNLKWETSPIYFISFSISKEEKILDILGLCSFEFSNSKDRCPSGKN